MQLNFDSDQGFVGAGFLVQKSLVRQAIKLCLPQKNLCPPCCLKGNDPTKSHWVS